MTRRSLPPGVELRRYRRGDGTVTETFAVRYAEASGARPRRSFDSLEDAMDFLAKRRSAKRWRPDELRQEQGGRQTLTEFFDEWWMTHGVVELKRSTLAVYRCLWETHAQPRLGSLPLRDIDARKVVVFRAELLEAGVGRHSVVKTLSMLQRVFRDAVEYGDVAFNPFKAGHRPVFVNAVPGDASEFVSDTLPNGSQIKPGAIFEKKWTIRNSGTVPWVGRRLERQGPLTGPGLITSARYVNVADTKPGCDVTISASLKAPTYECSAIAYFKMVDAAGALCFPGEHQVGLEVVASCRTGIG